MLRRSRQKARWFAPLPTVRTMIPTPGGNGRRSKIFFRRRRSFASAIFRLTPRVAFAEGIITR